MAITRGNIQEVHLPQNQTVQTLSSYVVPAGSDKILVISSSNSNNTGSTTSPTATFDGNAMTLIKYESKQGFGSFAAFYYLLGSSTPTGDIVVTWNRQANLGWGIHALTLVDAVQQGPEASVSSKQASGTTMSNAITALTDNAMIIDGIRNDTSFSGMTATGTGQVEIDEVGNDAQNRHATSYIETTTAGSHTVSWTVPSNDCHHIVSAWEEAGGGGSVGVTPGTGSIAITGQAPSADIPFAVTPGAGSVDITGYVPDIDLSLNLQPGAGSVDLTGFAPTIVLPRNLLPGAGSIDVSGLAPLVDVGAPVTLTPGAGSIGITGQIPTVVLPRNLEPGAGAVDIVGFAPSVETPIELTPAQGAIAVTGHIPEVSIPFGQVIPLGVITITGYAPTVNAVGETPQKLTLYLDPENRTLVLGPEDRTLRLRPEQRFRTLN